MNSLSFADGLLPARRKLAFAGSGGAARARGAAVSATDTPGAQLLALFPRIDVAVPAFWLYFADSFGSILIAAAIFSTMPHAGLTQVAMAGMAGFVPAWSLSAHLQRLYAAGAMLGGLRDLLLRSMATACCTLAALLAAGFASGTLAAVPRPALLASAAAAFGWIGLTRAAWRVLWRRWLERGARVERVLVLAETEAAARRLGEDVERESGFTFGVAAAAAFPGGVGASEAWAPDLDWVEAAARSGAIDRVVLGGSAAAMPRLNAVLARLARLAIDVSILPDLDGLRAPVLKVDRVGMLPAVELDFRPLTPFQVRIKRAEDLLLAGLITLFILPVLLMVVLAIRLDSPGPILFRQRRAGFNDRVFEVWKFRTMHVHARDELSRTQTSRADPRVTRVGRFLRRTSLDELPQLFNVLAGHMSIVGPRPHALGMTSVGMRLHDVIEDYSARHRLKPGITGWAQVNGSRGEVTSHEKLRRRVALDCYYIEHWSLRLDLWIVARTAAKVLFDRDAY